MISTYLLDGEEEKDAPVVEETEETSEESSD